MFLPRGHKNSRPTDFLPDGCELVLGKCCGGQPPRVISCFWYQASA